ncbi:hypothetical protein I6F11_27630 [Ensifer sp. NBAIM29]|nr:hypothetical protein [Ensifer sp. NBAIM29]
MDAVYPGDKAGVHDILQLARQYKAAANLLEESSQRGLQTCRIPGRFLALHSIELYLNAFLLAKGLEPKIIRGLQHDIAERSRRAVDAGLVLRKRTTKHLETLTSNREYLVARYGPDGATTLSQVNRVMATLEELSQKVAQVVERRCIAPGGGRPKSHCEA